MDIFDEIFHKVLKIKHFDTMRCFDNCYIHYFTMFIF